MIHAVENIWIRTCIVKIFVGTAGIRVKIEKISFVLARGKIGIIEFRF